MDAQEEAWPWPKHAQVRALPSDSYRQLAHLPGLRVWVTENLTEQVWRARQEAESWPSDTDSH